MSTNEGIRRLRTRQTSFAGEAVLLTKVRSGQQVWTQSPQTAQPPQSKRSAYAEIVWQF